MTPDVEDVKFEGNGCAISMASASMMSEAVKGKDRASVGALFDKALDAISMVSAVAMLAYRGTFPLWLFAIIAVKYAILFSLGSWLARRKCDYPQVYFIPRIRLGFGAPTVAGIICGAILPWQGARDIAQWATAALLVVSTVVFLAAAARARPRIPEPMARAN